MVQRNCHEEANKNIIHNIYFDFFNKNVCDLHLLQLTVGNFIPNKYNLFVLGYLIQRFLPKVSKFMTRIIKGFSSCLIIFIIIFAIVTNLYLFKLFSWRVSNFVTLSFFYNIIIQCLNNY